MKPVNSMNRKGKQANKENDRVIEKLLPYHFLLGYLLIFQAFEAIFTQPFSAQYYLI